MKAFHILAGLLCLALSLPAQVVQQTGAGQVDWQVRKIQATGIANPSVVGGRAGQIRAARADALRQILETVEGMLLTSETTVKDFMLENDVVYTEIRGVARNFQVVGDPVYMSDGSIELTVEMLLGRDFQDVLVGEMAFAEGSVTPVQFSDIHAGSDVYTGLIVDCRGLGIKPAMAPRVLSQSGEEIYGSSWADRDWTLAHGLAGYTRSVEQALENSDRIGGNPLRVKASAVTGSLQADAVIDDQSGKVLHALSENLTFLRECRVIFVVD